MAISVQGVTKIYETDRWGDLRDQAARWLRPRTARSKPSHCVLDDVSVDVGPGEGVCLLGPNGAGKSTLLRLVAGISRPTRGRIVVRGRVAPLIQLGAGFHRELTGQENAHLMAAMLGLTCPEIRNRLDSVFSFAELGDTRHLPLKRYSSGMASRLALSVALMSGVDILLIDEVLGQADAQFRSKCIQALQELLAAGGTVLLVTHEMDLAERLCSRGLFLQRGRVAADDVLQRVSTTYEGLASPGSP